MKRNDIRAMIRAKAEQEIPDVFAKIDLAAIQMPEPKKRKVLGSLFRTRFGVALQFALVVFVLGFTSILIYQSQLPQPQTQALDSEVEIYGFQMVSAASMLNLQSITPLSYSVSPSAIVPLHLSEDTDDTIISTKIPDLTTYINLMETMIGEKGSLSYQMETSDRPEYAFLLHYSTADLLGNTIEYRIYYNETADQEDANRSRIEGVLIQTDGEYQLRGTIISNEGVRKASFTALIDENNFITVDDQSNDSVQKYRYTRYEEGVLVSENEIKLVLADEHISAVISYQDEKTAFEYKIAKHTDPDSGEETIRVRYSCNSDESEEIEEDGDITVSIIEEGSTGIYQYHYAVQTRKGNSNQNHEYSGNRSDKVREDSNTENDDSGYPDHGNDDPGNEDPGNDNPGGDGSGSDDPGNGNPSNGNDHAHNQSNASTLAQEMVTNISTL